jgi:predicted transcriptional regulator of viral defense system
MSKSYNLITELKNQNKEFFRISDVTEILKGNSRGSITEMIRSLIKRGLVMRISDGLYNLIPFGTEAKEYFPNWHITAKEIVQTEKYYIGFYSALDIHGLITQPSLTEQIVTSKQMLPKFKIIKNTKFEFIYYNEKHFFGYENLWINDFEKVHCSDLEKTIIDCLYLPQYGSGITEISKAIYKAKDKIKSEKMIKYLEKFDSQAVMKRLGYILLHLDILYVLRKYIESNISKAYIPLDSSMPKTGKYYSKLGILDNVGIKDIKNSITT